MRLVVRKDNDLYRLWIEHGGERRPLLVPGDVPSWAGGWAGEDGTGAYRAEAALAALRAFGLSRRMAERALKGLPENADKDPQHRPFRERIVADLEVSGPCDPIDP